MNNAPIYDGGSAFPVEGHWDARHGVHITYPHPGISIRDYFAAHSDLIPEDISGELRAAIMSRPMPDYNVSALNFAMWHLEAEAIYRYMQADAMIKARSKP
jgi:hypothetical protein